MVAPGFAYLPILPKGLGDRFGVFLFVPAALLVFPVPAPVPVLFLPTLSPVRALFPVFRFVPVPVSPVMLGGLLFPPAGGSVIECVSPGLTASFGVSVVVQALSSAESSKTMRIHANIRFIFLPPDEYCCYTII